MESRIPKFFKKVKLKNWFWVVFFAISVYLGHFIVFYPALSS